MRPPMEVKGPSKACIYFSFQGRQARRVIVRGE
jgi:hypothetical protein